MKGVGDVRRPLKWVLFSPLSAILVSITALVCLGLVILSSAGQVHMTDSNIFHKQILGVFLGLIACVFCIKINLEKIKPISYLLFIFSILILLLVLIPGIGVKVNGSRRWLNLIVIRFQVSELAKIGLIFVLAKYFEDYRGLMHRFKQGFLIPIGLICVISGLIIIEPDFGTAFMCGLVGFTILFLRGAQMRYLIPAISSGGILFLIAIWLNPVRLKRLLSFMDVEANKSDGSYQLWQGILAFASGGTQGLGLGAGRQQINYLPEAHTDFIFPVIAEELGLFFTLGSVCAYIILFYAGIRIILRIPDLYYSIIALGSLSFVIFQAIFNIGVVSGLLPTKGISLPFISYGCSNMIVMFAMIGLLVNCYLKWSESPLLKPSEL